MLMHILVVSNSGVLKVGVVCHLCTNVHMIYEHIFLNRKRSVQWLSHILYVYLIFEHYQTVFQNGHIILYSHQKYMRVSIVSHLHQSSSTLLMTNVYLKLFI